MPPVIKKDIDTKNGIKEYKEYLYVILMLF